MYVLHVRCMYIFRCDVCARDMWYVKCVCVCAVCGMCTCAYLHVGGCEVGTGCCFHCSEKACG